MPEIYRPDGSADLDKAINSFTTEGRPQEKSESKGKLSIGQKAGRVAASAAILATSAIAGKTIMENRGQANFEDKKTETDTSITGGIIPEIYNQINAAPSNKMEVVNQADAAYNNPDSTTTLDGLRSKAGWSREYLAEFTKIMHERYPEGVSETGIIQPGQYEVPVNQSE